MILLTIETHLDVFTKIYKLCIFWPNNIVHEGDKTQGRRIQSMEPILSDDAKERDGLNALTKNG